MQQNDPDTTIIDPFITQTDVDIMLGWELELHPPVSLVKADDKINNLSELSALMAILGHGAQVINKQVSSDNFSDCLPFPALFGLLDKDKPIGFSISPALAASYMAQKTGIKLNLKKSLLFTEFEQGVLNVLLHEDGVKSEANTSFYTISKLWDYEKIQCLTYQSRLDKRLVINLFIPDNNKELDQINVVLSQLELTSSEIDGIKAGSILEFNIDNRSDVTFDVNNKRQKAKLKTDSNGFYVNLEKV